MIAIPPINLSVIAPLLVVGTVALVVMLMDLVLPAESRGWLAYLALGGLVVAMLMVFGLWGQHTRTLSDMVLLDNYGLTLTLIFLIVAGITVLLSVAYTSDRGLIRGEFYALILFAVMGMMVMATAGDLLVIFLGIELLSLPLYVLAGFARPALDSVEAALKYFLLGAFASGFLLYGIVLIFGAIGSTNLLFIAEELGRGGPTGVMLYAGVALLLVGLGFKVSVVPFHQWTPDVYEGAPTAVTAFMIAGTKAAGFAVLLRILLFAFPPLRALWVPIIAALAVVTMTVGNVTALVQQNIKRMLAYSSIAHAGYILVAVAAGGAAGTSSALFYLLVYAFMNLGAFAVVIAVSRGGDERVALSDYAGLARERPLLAAAMALFMLSLAGFPPTAGFFGKLTIFQAAVQNGLVWLAVVAVLNSVVSVYYYARVIVLMYMREGVAEPRAATGGPGAKLLSLGLGICVLGVLVLGILPAPVFHAAQRALLTVL
jgi:NADH-quinone oxidoreductase subunit N